MTDAERIAELERNLSELEGYNADLQSLDGLQQKRIADLEAACGVLGEECRAHRASPVGIKYLPQVVFESMKSTDRHPLAAQYVKPKETTDGK